MARHLDGIYSPRGMLLIVDEDAVAAASWARALRVEGYQVMTASGTEAGWGAVRISRPDAIILDLRMPLADRMIFLRRLRGHQHLRHTPIAVLTADYFTDEQLDFELDALNAVVCFKPLSLKDVVRLTEELLRGGP